jgi:hypothetical protein
MLGPLALLVLVAQTAPPDFDHLVAEIEERRSALGERYRRAPARQRPALLAEARRFVVGTIVDRLFPAWMGTPWGLGPNSNAARPHEPGKVVGCSYFVTGVLQNAGLTLESRARFAQAPALWIERALLPAGGEIHRFANLTPAALRPRIAALGDGLYLVGLDLHVGFLVVRGEEVRVVHASYYPPQAVTSEPLERSAVIAGSRSHVVSRLFGDDRLVALWLRRAPVPAPPPWPRRAVGAGQ